LRGGQGQASLAIVGSARRATAFPRLTASGNRRGGRPLRRPHSSGWPSPELRASAGGTSEAALLISAFLAALGGVGHARFIALAFAASLALLMASLVELTREIRVYMAYMHLD